MKNANHNASLPPSPTPPPPQPPPPPGLYPGSQSAYGTYGNPYGAEPSSFLSDITPARVLRIIRKKWITITLATLLALTVWGFYIYVTERIYESSALIELSVRRPRIMNQQDAVIGDTAMRTFDELINTQLQKFRGRYTRQVAIEELKQDEGLQDLDPGTKEELFRGQFPPVNYSLVKNSRLVRIISTHTSPAVAAAIANAHARATSRVAIEENRQASDAAVAWLLGQAQTQRKVLEEAEQALIEFRQETDLDRLRHELETSRSAANAYNQSLLDIRSSLIQAQEVVSVLESVKLEPEQIGNLPESLPRRDELGNAVTDWLSAITARDGLLSRYTERHPEVQAKDQQIQALRAKVRETLLRSRETAQAQVNLLEQQAASLDQEKSKAARTSVELELEIARATTAQGALEREREAQDISYRGILKRMEEARLSADENTAAITIVEDALAPRSPVHPDLFKTLGLALVGGFLFGLGIAFITDQMEDHIVSVSEVENLLNTRVTGLIPHAPPDQVKHLARIALEEPRSLIAEAYAGLRTMIDSMARGNPGIKTTLITSASPGTGKTTTSCNLAITRARSQHRVLLIDFDLRRPRVINALNLQDEKNGFIRYLRGESLEPSQLIQSMNLEAGGDSPAMEDHGRLDIIASAVAAEQSAADLIQSRRARELILWAQKNYDHIIIDSPPLGMIGDATALTAFANAVIFLVRPEISRKRATRMAVRHLQEVGVRQLFPVMNDVDFTSNLYGGYQYGGYYADYR
jgi:capsular exopolysaccharide synthesis family protein